MKPFPPVDQQFPSTGTEMRYLQQSLPTPSNCRVYTTAQLHKSGPIRAQMLRDALTSPDQTAAKLSHVPEREEGNREVSAQRCLKVHPEDEAADSNQRQGVLSDKV
ncbi:hypothetical protein Q8A73_011568 [Channa argus]|nr:hypothetical protein Q8A73_011568 [Channa argus]